jgi:hypothetical protein
MGVARSRPNIYTVVFGNAATTYAQPWVQCFRLRPCSSTCNVTNIKVDSGQMSVQVPDPDNSGEFLTVEKPFEVY